MLRKGDKAGKLIYLKPQEIRMLNQEDVDIGGLAESIRCNGIINPVTVRRLTRGYEIICGRRRFKAALAVGIRKIPAMLVDADDKTAEILRMTENLNRTEPEPYSVAKEVDDLMRRYRLSYHETAGRLGMSGSELTELLTLLRFTPEQIKKMQKKVEEPKEEIREEKTEPPKPSKIAVGDIRLFTNSIDRIISAMREAGYSVRSVTGETKDNIEYKIHAEKNRLPLIK